MTRKARATGHRPGEPEVHRITSAPRSQADDQHARIVKYTVSMSIRAVCLVLAFVVPGPMRWVFVAGAVVLPYVAVVLANAGREPTPPPPEAPSVMPRGSLGRGPSTDPRRDPPENSSHG